MTQGKGSESAVLDTNKQIVTSQLNKGLSIDFIKASVMQAIQRAENKIKRDQFNMDAHITVINMKSRLVAIENYEQ